MAQLVERSLPIPEVRISNPVFGIFTVEKTIEYEEKRGREHALFKKADMMTTMPRSKWAAIVVWRFCIWLLSLVRSKKL